MINTARGLYEPLQVVSDIPLNEFEERFALPEVPVVLQNMANDWPASKTWSLDNFSDKYGSLFVEVSRVSNGEKKSMTLQEYINYMRTTHEEHPYYLRNWEYEADFPGMKEEYKILPHFRSWLDTLPPDMQPGFRWIFIGPDKSYSRLHIDIFKTNAWNILFEGTKLWLFFPPDQEDLLKANAYHPDFPGYMFPNARGLKGFYAVQHPGEIVFTPGAWFHQVYNLGNTLALTENYINRTNYSIVEDHLISIENDELLAVLRALKKQFI